MPLLPYTPEITAFACHLGDVFEAVQDPKKIVYCSLVLPDTFTETPIVTDVTYRPAEARGTGPRALLVPEHLVGRLFVVTYRMGIIGLAPVGSITVYRDASLVLDVSGERIHLEASCLGYVLRATGPDGAKYRVSFVVKNRK
jgi:hypothetical protein